MNLKRTALYENHLKLGARMVDFGGWSLPLQYTSIIKEHLAVREGSAIFDTSHMGEIFISGEDTQDFIDYLITNDFKALNPGKCIYSPMCNERGGVVDDVIIHKFNGQKALIIANAANIKKDFDWIKSTITSKKFEVKVENESEHYAMLAVQGPKSMTYLNQLLPQIANLPPFSFLEFSIQGNDLPKANNYPPTKNPQSIVGIFSTTGYTGEIGGEIYLKNEHAPKLMEVLVANGVTPCGLGARDSLRLEKGYSLYGHELTEEINVLESGLDWTVKMHKPDFIGKKALIGFTPKNKLIGFVMESRVVARQDAPVWDSHTHIGHVTSGTFSPCLKKNIGLALVNQDFSKENMSIEIRGQKYRAKMTKRTFV